MWFLCCSSSLLWFTQPTTLLTVFMLQYQFCGNPSTTAPFYFLFSFYFYFWTVWSCIRRKGWFCASKTDISILILVLLLTIPRRIFCCSPSFFVHRWFYTYVCSICACLVLSVSSSARCLGRAAVCDCGTPWTFILLFLYVSFLSIYLYLNAYSSGASGRPCFVIVTFPGYLHL